MIMNQGERLFRLVARFTVHPGAEADFDELVRRATRLTLQNEQRVVTYICYQVEGQPQERIFYEEYENRTAFVEHQAQDHTRQFQANRDSLLESTEVFYLTPMSGGFRGPHPAVD
jgi:quinol monooxygenase YgiN